MPGAVWGCVVTAPLSPLSPEVAERLERLYRRYRGLVLAVARAHTRDADAADDVASESWVRVAVSLPRLRADDDHAAGWLSTVTVHAAARYYRPRRAAEMPTDWTDPVQGTRLPAAPAAESLALADPEPAPPAALRSALDCLPGIERRAVQLRADGLTFWAMAERCGTGRWAVTSAYRRGAGALRSRLAEGVVV